MLEHEPGHIGIVARQHELRQHSGDALDRPEKHLKHVDVVNADLQHHAAWHARGLISPGAEIDLAKPVAADIALRLHELAKAASGDLRLHPAEVALTPALIAERKNDAGLLAYAGDLPPLRHGVGDRFIKEDVFAGVGRHARGLEMYAVGRCINDRLN